MDVRTPPPLELELGREIPGKVYHVDFSSGVFWFMPDFLLPRLEEITNTLASSQLEINTR